MPHDQENKKIKQQQYCNKFNKDFKNGSLKTFLNNNKKIQVQ